VVRILQSFQVACTVVDIERTHAGAGASKAPNNRFMSFMAQCEGFEKYLIAGNLQGLTDLAVLATGAAAHGPEWTGASKARKAIIYADTDRVTPDITRTMMESPLAVNSSNGHEVE
jgi:hypothetical protein